MLTAAVMSAIVLNAGDPAMFILGREFGYPTDEVRVEILDALSSDPEERGYTVRLPNGYDLESNLHLIDPKTRIMRFRVEADLLVSVH